MIDAAIDLNDPFITSAVEAAKCRHMAVGNRSAVEDRAIIVSTHSEYIADLVLNVSFTPKRTKPENVE